MFKGLSDFFDDLRGRAEDFISNLLGGREAGDESPSPISDAPIVEHETDAPEDTDTYWEDEDFIEDTDPDEDDFGDYLDALDSIDQYERIGEELRTLQEYRGDPDALRVVRYATSEEAQDFLDSAGLSAFAEVLYDEDTDTYTIAVYDSPGSE